MLRPGFEPESSARKAEMIGRTTPPEQTIQKKFYQHGPNGLRTHDLPVMSRTLYLAKLWAQAPSTGLEPVTNRLTAERSTY